MSKAGITIWKCERCDSEQVFHKAFINPNTGESFDDGSDEGYCEECEDQTGNGDCTIYAWDNSKQVITYDNH